MSMTVAEPGAGPIIREWRTRRRLSQLDLALDAGVSTRHLSFVETGRSRPSASMVLHLAERLDVPLRERNRLLLAAGHAPVFGQHELDSPELAAAMASVETILAAYEPAPALAVDRHWGLVSANRAVDLLLADVSPALLEPPVNVLRISLHPDGLAPAIANLGQWRAHLLSRLAREAAASADAGLAALHGELTELPGPREPTEGYFASEVAIPLILSLRGSRLSFISMVTTFGTATDVTLAELSVEAFLPADRHTANTLGELLS